MTHSAPPLAAPDPVALTQALVRLPSVTPEEAGALTLLEETLAPFGFETRRVDVEGIANLYARWGRGRPCFAFAGHTDVVPVGDAAAWTRDPFSGEVDAEGVLWGRGATDMKSGVAAFVAAACRAVRDADPAAGSVALIVTGDEEGDALHGTRALLDWMTRAGEVVDACLVGEPTGVEALGDVMKIGRRGSLTAWFEARGRQGHAAYPHRAANPLPALVRLLDRLATARLDEGAAHFDPSTLAVTTVDVGNPATNVIPAMGRATVNIRFNDSQRSDALIAWLEREAAAAAESVDGVEISVRTKLSGDAFLTPPGPLSTLVADCAEAVVGRRPALTTGGGTSDARFIKSICPVVEFGIAGKTMHQVDECAPVEEIRRLADIYERVLRGFWAGGGR